MQSLTRANVNHGVFLVIALLTRLIFLDVSWFCYFALMISLYQFMLLFYSFGTVMPIRYLLGSFMCLQMLIGPTLAYNGLDAYQRGSLKMQIPEDQYFLYVIPAVLLFIVGLHLRADYLKGEYINQEKMEELVENHPNLPYLFVVIGFVASFISPFFGSDLGFLFYLLAGFKFIGAFLLIIGARQLKPITLILVYGSVVVSSLGEAMFHDLLMWVLFLGAVFAIKYKPSNPVKLAFVFAFISLAVFIQMIKGDYREATWTAGEEGSLETLQKTVESKQEKEGGIFDLEKLAANNVRINQGFIVTNIMKNVPDREPYAKGEQLVQILEAAILPRILAPNKLNAGDREFFMKWAGFRIARGTSMGLSSVGDGYVNFGAVGGAIFMLFYGLLFSEILNAIQYYSKYFPILILFTALMFYYPIRPDCELQTILGHLFKSCFLITVVMQLWKYIFKQA